MDSFRSARISKSRPPLNEHPCPNLLRFSIPHWFKTFSENLKTIFQDYGTLWDHGPYGFLGFNPDSKRSIRMAAFWIGLCHQSANKRSSPITHGPPKKPPEPSQHIFKGPTNFPNPSDESITKIHEKSMKQMGVPGNDAYPCIPTNCSVLLGKTVTSQQGFSSAQVHDPLETKLQINRTPTTGYEKTPLYPHFWL